MNDKEEVFSKLVRAGRRTYFFDVKTTKANDYYLTITESKKFTNDDGSFRFEKHKIYLYREDLESFKNTLKEVTDFIVAEKGAVERSDFQKHTEKSSDISFDEL